MSITRAVTVCFILGGFFIISGCANDPNRPPNLALTDNNPFKKNCNPLGGRFDFARCSKAQEKQREINEREQQRVVQAEQKRIRDAAEKAEWERIKNDPLNSSEIAQLQNGLRELGYNSVPESGVLDFSTSEAIRTLQSKDNQPVTGAATKEVLVAVKRKVGRKQQNAQNAALVGLLFQGLYGGGGGIAPAGRGSVADEENFRRRMDNANRNNPNYMYQ